MCALRVEWKKVIIFVSLLVFYNCLLYGFLKWHEVVAIRICCTKNTCKNISNDSFSDIATMSEATKLSEWFRVEKIPIEDDCFPIEYPFEFFENGTVAEMSNDTQINELYNPDSYCVLRDQIDSSLTVLVCNKKISDQTENLETSQMFFYMNITLPFLIIVYFIYEVTKGCVRTYEKCVISYSISLAFLYASLAVNTSICSYTFELITFASVLCCISWLNILCYAAKSFRDNPGINLQADETNDSQTFYKYLLLGFGLPVAVTASYFLIDFLVQRLVIQSFSFTPRDFFISCWPNNSTERCTFHDILILVALFPTVVFHERTRHNINYSSNTEKSQKRKRRFKKHLFKTMATTGSFVFFIVYRILLLSTEISKPQPTILSYSLTIFNVIAIIATLRISHRRTPSRDILLI